MSDAAGERRLRPESRRRVRRSGELLRGDETPGERGFLARGRVAVDHALADRAIHRNTAARKKSALARRLVAAK